MVACVFAFLCCSALLSDGDHFDPLPSSRGFTNRSSLRGTDTWDDFLRQHTGQPELCARPDSNIHAVVCRTLPNRFVDAPSLGSVSAISQSMLFVCGAAVTCSVCARHVSCSMLGGEDGFAQLMSSALTNEVNVVVQFNGCISASRAHRRYRGLETHCINDSGLKVPHMGTDGRANQWEDQSLLNYRKKATWDLMVDEVS